MGRMRAGKCVTERDLWSKETGTEEEGAKKMDTED